jgi:HPt (histidine-containing phosphotransfer) domain-containing protein
MEGMKMTSYNSLAASQFLDEGALLDSVGGDTDFLIELIGLFLAACPTLLSQIRKALAANDCPAATRAARILKSALRSFAAEHVLSAVEALEAAAYQHERVVQAETFEALEKEIGCLTSALSDLEGFLHANPCAARGHDPSQSIPRS